MPLYFHFRSPIRDFNGQLMCRKWRYVKADGHQCQKTMCIDLPYCYIHNRIAFKLRVKPSRIPNAGVGLFVDDTEQPIGQVIYRKGDKICPYYGAMINEAEVDRRYDGSTAPYTLQVQKGLSMDGALQRGIGTLINHKSFQQGANCVFGVDRQNNAFIKAYKDIRNGDELYCNYNPNPRGKRYIVNEEGVEYATNRNKYN